MERRVLIKEVERATTIAEIQLEMVNAMNTPNIFKTNTQKSQSNQDQQPKEEEIKDEVPQEIEESPNSEELIDDYKLLDENKETVYRLLKEKSSTFLSLSTGADFTTFYIELKWVRIPYYTIIKYFLWDKILKSQESTLKKHVMLCKKTLPESLIEEWRNKFREEIIKSGVWFNLENSIQAKKDFYVTVDGKIYRYRAIMSVFWPIRDDVKQKTPEAYRDLSSKIFWKTWRVNLTAEMQKRNIQNQIQQTLVGEPELKFEEEKEDEIEDEKDDVKDNTNESDKDNGIEDKNGWNKKDWDKENGNNSWEPDEEPVVKKKTQPKKSKEQVEFENNRLMIRKLAKEKLEKNPELKVLWFWPETKEWINSFRFEYNWEDLTIRKMAEMVWYLKPKQGWLVPFKKIKELIFEKDFIEQMEKEAEEEIKIKEKEKEKERKRLVEEQRLLEEQKKAEELKKRQDEFKRVREENWYIEVITEASQEINTEDAEIQLGEYAELFYQEMDERWIVIPWDLYSDKKTVLNALGVVVENYFESKKERFETVFEEYMDKELKNIISNCSRRYRKSDPALKDFCPSKEFVENTGTEFLIIKEEEFITRVSEYFDKEEKNLDIKTYCWAALDWLTHSNIEQDYCDYFTDKIEEIFKKSHDNDEKSIVKQLKEDERKIKEAEKEKKNLEEAEEFCKKNNITLEEYKALVFLSNTLDRDVWDNGFDKIMKYLLKIKSRNDVLRAEEYKNEFTPEIIAALEVLHIRIQEKEVKDTSKSNGAKKKTKKKEDKETPTVKVITQETSNLVLWDNIWDNFIVIAKTRWIVIDNAASFKKEIHNLCKSENLKNKLSLQLERENFRIPEKRWNSYYYYVNGFPWAFVGKKEWNEIHIIWRQESK